MNTITHFNPFIAPHLVKYYKWKSFDHTTLKLNESSSVDIQNFLGVPSSCLRWETIHSKQATTKRDLEKCWNTITTRHDMRHLRSFIFKMRNKQDPYINYGPWVVQVIKLTEIVSMNNQYLKLVENICEYDETFKFGIFSLENCIQINRILKLECLIWILFSIQSNTFNGIEVNDESSIQSVIDYATLVIEDVSTMENEEKRFRIMNILIECGLKNRIVMDNPLWTPGELTKIKILKLIGVGSGQGKLHDLFNKLQNQVESSSTVLEGLYQSIFKLDKENYEKLNKNCDLEMLEKIAIGGGTSWIEDDYNFLKTNEVEFNTLNWNIPPKNYLKCLDYSSRWQEQLRIMVYSCSDTSHNTKSQIFIEKNAFHIYKIYNLYRSFCLDSNIQPITCFEIQNQLVQCCRNELYGIEVHSTWITKFCNAREECTSLEDYNLDMGESLRCIVFDLVRYFNEFYKLSPEKIDIDYINNLDVLDISTTYPKLLKLL
jgi:hypothetical protein